MQLPALSFLVVNGVPFRQHSLMQDSRDKDPAAFGAVKDHMTGALHPPQAGPNFARDGLGWDVQRALGNTPQADRGNGRLDLHPTSQENGSRF